MTQTGFLQALERDRRLTGRKWLVTSNHEIRTRAGRCPIEYLGKVRRPGRLAGGDVNVAAERLGLDSRTVNRIVNAADFHHEFFRAGGKLRPLRLSLLGALGLQERR